MKKSSFVALVSGTISMVLFALGMCMALIHEWNAFNPGVIMGCLGIVMALITVIIWRRMEHKEPIKISGKSIFTIFVALIGTLGLGVGMCLTRVWSYMVLGIIVGLAGIIVLLMLIPICIGLK